MGGDEEGVSEGGESGEYFLVDFRECFKGMEKRSGFRCRADDFRDSGDA